MTKDVLACDVDEVLFPLLDNFLEDYNQANSTDIAAHEFMTYDFDKPLGLSVPETIDTLYKYLHTDHSHIEPLEGVEDALGRLSRNFELEIVTARHPQFEIATLHWLQDKLPVKFRSIKLIGYAAIMEKPVTKAEICHEIGAVALIDDSVEHVTTCAENGVEGVLFGNYSWNQTDKLPQGVTRCESWQLVAEHFNV